MINISRQIFLAIAIFSILAILPIIIFSQGTATQSANPNFTNQLQKLNQYLKTFDNGFYGFVEIVNDTLYVRYKSGKSAYFKMSDISEVSILDDYSNSPKVAFMCKDNKKCIGSDFVRPNDNPYLTFQRSGEFDPNELFSLLSSLVKTYKEGAISTITTIDTSKNISTPTIQTPKTIQTPTPTPTPTPVALKTGMLSDCKIILSEGCRNYFFQTPISEISNELGIKAQYDKDISMDLYRGDGITLIVDPTTGRISSLTITEYNKLGLKPNNKVKWEANWEKVKKEFGEGRSYNDGIHYPTFTVDFRFSKLYSVTFFGPKDSKEEEAAYWNRRRTDIQAGKESEREAEIAANPPEAIERKKQQMEIDYNELLNQLDAKLREGERIVNSEKMAIAAGGLFKQAVQNKIDKVIAAGDSLIDQFGKKYQGIIPAWMVKGIKDKWRPVTYPQ